MVALGYVTHKKRVRHSFTLFKHNYAIKRKEPFLHRKAHILPFDDLTKTPNTPEYTHPPSLIFVLLFLFLFFLLQHQDTSAASLECVECTVLESVSGAAC